MRTLRSLLGYTAAALVLAVMLLLPFMVMPALASAIGRLGVQPHPKFAGGPVARVLERQGYRIEISAPAGALGPLEQVPRFVQLRWTPASALPPGVSEALDLDGDGRPEVRISFEVPREDKLPLQGRVEVLDPAKAAPVEVLGRQGLSALLVRSGTSIVARVPILPAR